MELLHNLYIGFNVAVLPINLLFCFIGVFLGTMVGVLPGIGPAATISVLLPITFTLRPETAIIMLAGIFYGTQYGGSTTSILVNLPGEATSVIRVWMVTRWLSREGLGRRWAYPLLVLLLAAL